MFTVLYEPNRLVGDAIVVILSPQRNGHAVHTRRQREFSVR